MPTLAELITDRKNLRGWTYNRLQELSNDQITSQRWQQLATGVRLREFPEPTTLQAIADAIEVEVTTVLLAVARSLGLPIRQHGSDLATMLPAAARDLTSKQRDAILAVVVAMRDGHTSESIASDPQSLHESRSGGLTRPSDEAAAKLAELCNAQSASGDS